MNLSDTLQIYSTGEYHQYCSTQFNLPEGAAEQVRALAAKIPDSDLAGNGRETLPHVTIKYGLKGSQAQALTTLKRLLSVERPLTATVGKTSYFAATPSSDGADVVILELSSPDLLRLNRLISTNVSSVTTFLYRPHVTVAYVKKGLGKKYSGNPALLNTKVVFDMLYLSSRNETMVPISLGPQEQVAASYQVQRINNEPGFQGPELYRVVDETGKELGTSRDEAGAVLQRDALMRKETGLGKRPEVLDQSDDLLYGRDVPQDNRLRRTTGGTGGTGGPGNG